MSLRHKTTRPNRADNESGFTISELMVSIILISIFVILVGGFFSGSFRDFFRLQQQSIKAADLSSSIQRIARTVRGIERIEQATATELTGYVYYSPRDSKLTKVHFYYLPDLHELRADTIPASGTGPDYTYNQNDTTTRTIATFISEGQPIFRYFDVNGIETNFDPSTYQNIKMIAIELISLPTMGNNPTTLKTTVMLRNQGVL